MIRYAGVHTLLPTPELDEFVNANLPPGVAQYFCPPGNGSELGVAGRFMPGNKWNYAPTPRINTLYWPTGASRWASMLLLVDDSMLDTIVPLTSAAFSAGLYEAAGKQLVLADTDHTGTITDDEWSQSEDGKKVALSTEMFALTPHPVSNYASASKKLWILPIVDQRWFWQWEPILASDPTTTWASILTYLGDRVSSETAPWIPDDIDTEYDDSDVIDLTDYRHIPVGKTIDAICRLIGHRFTRTIKKSLRTYRFSTANTRWTANTVDADGPTVFGIWRRLAGGEFTYRAAATMPTKLYIGSDVRPGMMTEVNTRDVGATAFAPWKASILINTTADLGAVAAVANRIATDWVGWRTNKKADQAFIGVKAWDPCGYEDCIIISMGNLRESPSTRIVTLPENFGVEDWAGGGSVACTPSYEIRHWYFPSAGTSEIEVTYATVTETITLDFNATAAEVQTAINAHSAMVTASVTCTASSISGGTLYNSAVIVRMPDGGTIGLSSTASDGLTADTSTDFEPKITVVECGCQ